MRLVRSWPRNERADRSRVVDDATRVRVDDYDYRGLYEVGDDLINLDWDIAVHREDVEEFAARARRAPDRVLVAPYRIYPDTRPGLGRAVWPMRRFEGATLRYVETDEPTCHLFGFGMTYLPRALLDGFAEAHPDLSLDDNRFSMWHHQHVEAEVRIAWDIRPVHLNYRISSVSL